MMDRYERHQEICIDLHETYKIKNVAYGNSFGKTFSELGVMSAVVRMSDKFNRVVALAKGAENKVTDESMQDTLRDLANYAIMTLIELEMAKYEQIRT